MSAISYQQVLDFWFEEIDSSLWWKKDATFDQLLRERFGELHRQATQGELASWRSSAQGRLAEIIVLDQFSRNIYRDTPQAFAYDGMALVLAQEAVAQQLDTELSDTQRSFLYLPYMHSESLVIHNFAVTLYEQNGLQNNLDFELQHRAIIARFGRYPHRNAILSRASTSEEIAFLNEPNSSF